MAVVVREMFSLDFHGSTRHKQDETEFAIRQAQEYDDQVNNLIARTRSRARIE